MISVKYSPQKLWGKCTTHLKKFKEIEWQHAVYDEAIIRSYDGSSRFVRIHTIISIRILGKAEKPDQPLTVVYSFWPSNEMILFDESERSEIAENSLRWSFSRSCEIKSYDRTPCRNSTEGLTEYLMNLGEVRSSFATRSRQTVFDVNRTLTTTIINFFCDSVLPVQRVEGVMLHLVVHVTKPITSKNISKFDVTE
jgi:hypothetical protein